MAQGLYLLGREPVLLLAPPVICVEACTLLGVFATTNREHGISDFKCDCSEFVHFTVTPDSDREPLAYQTDNQHFITVGRDYPLVKAQSFLYDYLLRCVNKHSVCSKCRDPIIRDAEYLKLQQEASYFNRTVPIWDLCITCIDDTIPREE